jgi:hypothetical protein
MTRNLSKTSAAVAAILGLFAATEFAAAAELVRVEGKVSVSRGGGFETASQGMMLQAGDKVLVGEESSASLLYADPGCVFEVAPASIATVAESAPCVSGESVSQGESVFVTPVQDQPPVGEVNMTPLYVMGGIGFAGTVVGFIAIHEEQQDDDDDDGVGAVPPASRR